jgi:low temperature requirement protein LtrA
MAKRQWWQKPQLRTDEDQNIHRKVSWLELFFDLIFVVVVAELSHYLAKQVSLEGVGSFILLFLPVW